MVSFSFDTGGRGKKSNILTLTPLGKQKVEALAGDGPEFMVLSALAENGPSTLQDIGAATGLGKEKCKIILKGKLIPQGFVTAMKTGGEQQ